MVTLYKRATPAQIQALRIIEGAVKNATDAHPGLRIGPGHRRSIAKRAVGTLTARWPEVLAGLVTPSSGVPGVTYEPSANQAAQCAEPPETPGGHLLTPRGSPFDKLADLFFRPLAKDPEMSMTLDAPAPEALRVAPEIGDVFRMDGDVPLFAVVVSDNRSSCGFLILDQGGKVRGVGQGGSFHFARKKLAGKKLAGRAGGQQGLTIKWAL